LRSSAFLGRGGWGSEASAEDILERFCCVVVGFRVMLVDLFVCLYEVGAWERKAVGGLEKVHGRCTLSLGF
jgi:hypothetical protein